VVVLLDKSGFFCRKGGGHFFNTPLPTDDFFVLFFSNQNLLEPRGEDAPPLPPKREQYYAMIDGKEGAKENARKKRFFLRFRAAVSR